MADATFRQGGQKGTVYDGPLPPAKGTVYNGPSVPAVGGTVYNGPAPGGTVYGGAAAGTTNPRYSAGAATAINAGAARGARIFYLIAGFTAINTVLMFVGIRFALGVGNIRLDGASTASVVLLNLVAAGIFVLLGVFTQGGSKITFLVGMLLYAGDLVLLLLNNPGLHIISIAIHALFLYSLFTAFRQLPE
jgi:hypothetical protein